MHSDQEVKPVGLVNPSVAYSYIRFSTSEQAKGDSFKRQTELVQTYCLNNNLELNDTLVDLGVSAYDSSNTNEDAALGRFLQLLQEGHIQTPCYLLVESLDRLSRQKTLAALSQLLDLINKGVTIVTLLDNQVYDLNADTTQLIISLTIMERSYNESLTKSQRISSAWQRKRTNKTKTSVCPFWLDFDGEDYIPNHHVEAIKKIFELSVSGYGVYSIQKHMTAHFEPPKSNWGTTTINRLLTNKAVIGTYTPTSKHHAVEPIPDYYPSVIDSDVFYESLSKMQSRSNPRSSGRKSNFPNPVSGLAKCSCGSSMYYSNKGKFKYLACYAKCPKPIRFEKFEQFLSQVFLTPLYARHFIESKQVNTHSQQAQLQILETDLRSFMETAKQVSSEYLTSELVRRTQEIESLKSEIEQIHQEAKPNIHLSFGSTVQLVANALQKQVHSAQPEKLSPEELVKVRHKLNALLKGTFSLMEFDTKEQIIKVVALDERSYQWDEKWKLVCSS